MNSVLRSTLNLLICLQVLALPTFSSPTLETMASKEWTLLVFMNGDNNLDSFGLKDFKEMEKIGSGDQLNIVVQYDQSHGKPAKRYLVHRKRSEVLEDLGEVDMGDIRVFTDFVKWGIEHYRAKHYAVVFWNHGTGWELNSKGSFLQGISYDDQSGNHIDIDQIGPALKEINEVLGRKIDILGFDACLMQMLEVAYAVKDGAVLMVGSEELEPGKGWPYDKLLKPWQKNPSISPESLAHLIVEVYDEAYDGFMGQNTTMSYLRLAEIDPLVEALNEFSLENMGKYPVEIRAALKKVEKFDGSSNIDLGHFLDLYQPMVTDDATLKSKIRALKNQLKQVIGFNLTNSNLAKNAQGLAIYHPTYGYALNQNYLKLSFSKDTLWDELLQAYFESSKTRLEDL
jgi:hypothetical protein